MKFLKLGFIFAAFALFIIACSQNQTTNTTVATNTAVVVNSNANTSSAAMPAATIDELASAKKIYSEKCVKCHKEDGSGRVTDIEGTKIKAPSFASPGLKKDPDSELIEVIENGAKEDGMPAFKGKISDEDIKNLVKLIRRDFQK